MIQLNILRASLWLVEKQYEGGQEKKQDDQIQVPSAAWERIASSLDRVTVEEVLEMSRSWVYFEGRAAGSADGPAACCDREKAQQ